MSEVGPIYSEAWRVPVLEKEIKDLKEALGRSHEVAALLGRKLDDSLARERRMKDELEAKEG